MAGPLMLYKLHAVTETYVISLLPGVVVTPC